MGMISPLQNPTDSLPEDSFFVYQTDISFLNRAIVRFDLASAFVSPRAQFAIFQFETPLYKSLRGEIFGGPALPQSSFWRQRSPRNSLDSNSIVFPNTKGVLIGAELKFMLLETEFYAHYISTRYQYSQYRYQKNTQIRVSDFPDTSLLDLIYQDTLSYNRKRHSFGLMYGVQFRNSSNLILNICTGITINANTASFSGYRRELKDRSFQFADAENWFINTKKEYPTGKNFESITLPFQISIGYAF